MKQEQDAGGAKEAFSSRSGANGDSSYGRKKSSSDFSKTEPRSSEKPESKPSRNPFNFRKDAPGIPGLDLAEDKDSDMKLAAPPHGAGSTGRLSSSAAAASSSASEALPAGEKVTNTASNQTQLSGLIQLLQSNPGLSISQLAKVLNVPLDPSTSTLLENLNLQLLVAAATKQAQGKLAQTESGLAGQPAPAKSAGSGSGGSGDTGKYDGEGFSQTSSYKQGYGAPSNPRPQTSMGYWDSGKGIGTDVGQSQVGGGSTVGEQSSSGAGVKAALAQLLAQQGIKVTMGGQSGARRDAGAFQDTHDKGKSFASGSERTSYKQDSFSQGGDGSFPYSSAGKPLTGSAFTSRTGTASEGTVTSKAILDSLHSDTSQDGYSKSSYSSQASIGFDKGEGDNFRGSGYSYSDYGQVPGSAAPGMEGGKSLRAKVQNYLSQYREEGPPGSVGPLDTNDQSSNQGYPSGLSSAPLERPVSGRAPTMTSAPHSSSTTSAGIPPLMSVGGTTQNTQIGNRAPNTPTSALPNFRPSQPPDHRMPLLTTPPPRARAPLLSFPGGNRGGPSQAGFGGPPSRYT